MAELNEPGDEPNFDMFWSFGLDCFSEDKLLLTETDLTEKTKQTEIGQLNDEELKSIELVWLSCCLRHSHRQNQDVLDTLTRK